jgi:hypothetical protein
MYYYNPQNGYYYYTPYPYYHPVVSPGPLPPAPYLPYVTQPNTYMASTNPNYLSYKGWPNPHSTPVDVDFSTDSNNKPETDFYPTGDEVEIIPDEWKKEPINELLENFINQNQGYNFNKVIQLGDLQKYINALNSVALIIDKTIGEALYVPAKDALGLKWPSYFSFNKVVLPKHPSLDINGAEPLWHELTHRIEDIEGDPFNKGKAYAERNIQYMEAVEENLVWLRTAEDLAKKGASIEELKRYWQRFVKGMNRYKIYNLYTGKKWGPGLEPNLKLMKDWFGFDVDLEKIQQFYASGAAGEKLKKMVTPIDGDEQPSTPTHMEYKKCIQSCYTKYKDNEQKYLQCIESCKQPPPEPIPSEPSKILKSSADKGGNKVSPYSEVKWAFAIPLNLYDTGQIAMKTDEAKLRFVAKWYWKNLTVNVQLSSAYQSENLTKDKRRLTIPYTYTWNGADHRGKTHQGKEQSKTSIDYYVKDLKEGASINIDTSSFTLQGPNKD